MTATPSRKQRRRAAAANGAPSDPTPLNEIPLTQPDRSGPQAPTLYDLAAAREAELRAQIPAHEAKRQKQRGGNTNNTDTQPPRSPQTAAAQETIADDPLLVSLLYCITLSTLHLTLDILVWTQYAQAPSYRQLTLRNVKTTLPLAFILVYVFHAPWFGLAKVPWLRRALLLAAAVAGGVYAVQLSNEGAYLAVMKRVPPCVTLVLWAVMEMEVGWAVGVLGVIGGVAWWEGWRVV